MRKTPFVLNMYAVNISTVRIDDLCESKGSILASHKDGLYRKQSKDYAEH
jgi:hypothetical protein